MIGYGWWRQGWLYDDEWARASIQAFLAVSNHSYPFFLYTATKKGRVSGNYWVGAFVYQLKAIQQTSSREGHDAKTSKEKQQLHIDVTQVKVFMTL